jgi:prolyl oligopeptidase PreP (S9A serine peptidase family)
VLKTDFEDEEFVVYSTTQQRMSYLVEFSTIEDVIATSAPVPLLASVTMRSASQQSDMLVPVIDYADIDESALSLAAADDKKVKLSNVRIGPYNSCLSHQEVQEIGLMSKSGQGVPLKSVHVRAQVRKWLYRFLGFQLVLMQYPKLLDLVGRVVVLQHYRNDSTEPIEAKFVRPINSAF